MIRHANLPDIKEIMKTINETITEMHSYGNTQWDENYPQEKDFMTDIQKGDLYVCERNEKLVGFACINKAEPDEYSGLPWTLQETALIVHRMAVTLSYRRSGIGTELMEFAEKIAFKNNIRYLKTDTYSLNAKMNALFSRCGYNLVGEMSFHGKERPFYCYEKIIKFS